MAAFLEGVRPTTWRGIFLAIASYGAVQSLTNALYLGSLEHALDDLEIATNGWVGCLLVLPLPTFAVVSAVILGIGGLRPADVGWRRSAIVPAVGITLFFWLAMQASLWLMTLHAGDSPAWEWRCQWYAGSPFGVLLIQVFGIVLLEETFFRGYLLPQVFLRLAPLSTVGVALVCASLDSVALFVLAHVQTYQISGFTGPELGQRLLWVLEFGVAMNVLFLVTGNVFLCVGLHALWNARPMLFEASTESVDRVWWIGMAVLLVGALCAKGIRSPWRARLRTAVQ